MDFKKIYTPNQILVCSMLFGPFVSAYFLDANFKILDKGSKRISAALYLLGLLITLALCFVPSGKIYIHLTYSYIAYSLADRKQVPQKKIKESDKYKTHSILNLILVSVLGLAAVVIVAFASIFTMTIIQNLLN